MIKRIPIFPTMLVTLACLTMIGLGVWQLDRANWKAGLLEQYRTAHLQPQMSFPITTPNPEHYLFRKAGAMCFEPRDESVTFAGRKNGALAYRHVVRCRTGVEGPGILVDIGWSSDANAKAAWAGGAVTGVISEAPNEASLIGKLLGTAPASELMLIAVTPAPGFKPSNAPKLDEIPNSHLAYAGQWFFFALVAAVIYGIALWRRLKPDAAD